MAAVAGGLWAHVQKVISPSFFYYDRTFDIVETSIIAACTRSAVRWWAPSS
jgi:ABC-type branched-subunit amino acid transport system permease subunit